MHYDKLFIQECHRAIYNEPEEDWYDDPNAPEFDDAESALKWMSNDESGGHGQCCEHRLIRRMEEVLLG